MNVAVFFCKKAVFSYVRRESSAQPARIDPLMHAQRLTAMLRCSVESKTIYRLFNRMFCTRASLKTKPVLFTSRFSFAIVTYGCQSYYFKSRLKPNGKYQPQYRWAYKRPDPRRPRKGNNYNKRDNHGQPHQYRQTSVKFYKRRKKRKTKVKILSPYFHWTVP